MFQTPASQGGCAGTVPRGGLSLSNSKRDERAMNSGYGCFTFRHATGKDRSGTLSLPVRANIHAHLMITSMLPVRVNGQSIHARTMITSMFPISSRSMRPSGTNGSRHPTEGKQPESSDASWSSYSCRKKLVTKL